MKVLFFRGAWDERTQKSIDDDDDMWLQLADGLGDADIIFFGSDKTRHIKYRNSDIWAYKDLSKIDGDWDVVFARGGFKEYDPVVARLGGKKVYYGAGRRFCPNSKAYDIVLCDSEFQREAIGENARVWSKPAASHFKPMEGVKTYDLCYIANGQQAEIKGTRWVYDTKPEPLNMLHLGYPSKYRVPERVVQVREDRRSMPMRISTCKVGIVPYWDGIDSAPRALIEMLACGIPCVVADTVPYNGEALNCYMASKEDFWNTVFVALKNGPRGYEPFGTRLDCAVSYIKGLLSK